MDKSELEALRCKIVDALGDRNLSEIARRTGISSDTMERLKRGDGSTLSTLIALKNYLLIDTEETARNLRAVLLQAVNQYGKEGGPWNVPSDPGGWLTRAKRELGIKR